MIKVEVARQALYRTILFIGICGFEIAAGFTSLVETASTPASIAVRFFLASCAALAIFIDFSKALSAPRSLILGYCFFWYLYLLRVAYATTLSTERLAFDTWYYYSWAVGACALPMLGIALWCPRREDGDRNFRALFVALSIGGFLAAFGASSVEVNDSNQMVETGRLQLTALNPILLGQLGATMVVMTVWVLTSRFKSYGLIAKLLFVAVALVGVGLLVGANSRGPLVSAAACLLFISLVSGSKSRIYAMVFLISSIIAFVPVTQYMENEFGISTYTRLFGQSQLTEENTLDRLSRYDGALSAFSENPLFGSSLEEPTHGGYPHNFLVEALMATGVVGFSLLVILLSVTFAYAVRLYAIVPGYGWVSVIFVQYIIAAQFSGSIYTINYLWITSGLVISIYSTLGRKVNQ